MHPLYYLIEAVWVQLTGTTEALLRAPSVVFGSLAVCVYLTIAREIGGKKAALLGLALVVSPFLVWYARDARPYALIMFLSSVHLLCYLRALEERGGRLGLFLLGLTGVLVLYSGIFTGMLLAGEVAWALVVQRNARVTAVLSVVLLLSAPLVWHGWRTYFEAASDRYREIPHGVTLVRLAGFPQEFFVGRSYGPTPAEVRSFRLGELVRQKGPAVVFEVFVLACLVTSLLVAVLRSRTRGSVRQRDFGQFWTLAGVIALVLIQAAFLIAVTGYQMNARHVGFVFGPAFVLACALVARIEDRRLAALYVLPLVALWSWSTWNQLFDLSYEPDAYRRAASVVKAQGESFPIVALCLPGALRYYGVKNAADFVPYGASASVATLQELASKHDDRFWLAIGRPWSYPHLQVAQVEKQFTVIRHDSLPGIELWLLKNNGSRRTEPAS